MQHAVARRLGLVLRPVLGLARAVHERWPPIKIILVSGALKLGDIDIPPDSRFFGKPITADAMIAEMQQMIGHA